jgi:hypothetical protein
LAAVLAAFGEEAEEASVDFTGAASEAEVSAEEEIALGEAVWGEGLSAAEGGAASGIPAGTSAPPVAEIFPRIARISVSVRKE